MSMTVRPFTSTAPCHRSCPLRPTRPIRVIVVPFASKKGFGEPKKEHIKRPEVSQPQQQEPVAPASSFQAPPATAPRRRMVRETPQVVSDRMFRRMMTFTFVPVFGGMGLFVLFYWLRVIEDIEYPLWIVYVAQTLTFGGALVGITYGALSASWDPAREGSALGFKELQANLYTVLNKDKQ